MGEGTYESTRRAWAGIWGDEADIERELATVDYRRSRQTRARYLRYLPREELVLDGGCGLGIELIQLGRMGYRIIGVDYAENALHQISAYQRSQLLTVGDIHNLPYRDGVFGAYLSFGVLEHFEFGPEPGLREANRVLREGASLVLTVPYPSLVWRLVQLKGRLIRRPRTDDSRCYETRYSVGQLEESLCRTGFVVVERHPIGHSFTLWGLGWPFRAAGYYETSKLAELLGAVCARLLPWATCFASLVIARKAGLA
jgi:SAM-dependent methyltransferase